MSGTLVVYYTRTGRTGKVAAEIADRLQGDLDEIREPGKRRGILGFLRSGFEALGGRLAAIEEPGRNPAEYDLVIVGTPVWATRMSSPVRTYLTRYRNRLPEAAFFCTSDGPGNQGALREMAALCDKKPLALLAVARGDLRDGRYTAKLEHFIDGLRAGQG